VDKRLQIGAADASPAAGPGVAFVDARRPLAVVDSPLRGERPPFLFEREIVGRPRAVDQSHLAVRHPERLMQHGAQRRDAGAAGDEEKSPLRRIGGKRERTHRAVDVDERPRFERKGRPGGRPS